MLTNIGRKRVFFLLEFVKIFTSGVGWPCKKCVLGAFRLCQNQKWTISGWDNLPPPPPPKKNSQWRQALKELQKQSVCEFITMTSCLLPFLFLFLSLTFLHLLCCFCRCGTFTARSKRLFLLKKYLNTSSGMYQLLILIKTPEHLVTLIIAAKFSNLIGH